MKKFLSNFGFLLFVISFLVFMFTVIPMFIAILAFILVDSLRNGDWILFLIVFPCVLMVMGMILIFIFPDDEI